MITDEKIIKAASKCLKQIEHDSIPLQASERDTYIVDNSVQVGFFYGAHWAIQEFLKSLWYDASEEPDKSESDIITLGFDNDAYLQFKESILWQEESWRHSVSRCAINKWAYLSDILPKQEGGEQ